MGTLGFAGVARLVAAACLCRARNDRPALPTSLSSAALRCSLMH